jgi:hypothetical protein
MFFIYHILNSVKQGDALSCALFTLAVEPLLLQLKRNENIQPITLNPGDDREVNVNNFGFADDITAICKNKRGIQEIISSYEKFTKISGITLNVPKTEIMIIGDKEKTKKQFRIKYNQENITIINQDSVKICGITFSNDKEYAYNENIKKKVLKMERQLNIWRQRNISLEGKILLVKCFGLSQLIYSLQASHIRQQEIKQIENIIYKFIWNISPSSTRTSGKIKRETLQASTEDGGLNAPNVKALNDAIKYRHLLRCFHTNHPVGILTKVKLQKIQFNEQSQLVNHREDKSYLDQAVNAHNKLWNLFDKDIQTSSNEPELKLHRSYYYYLHNHQLLHSQHINAQQKFMVKNLRRHGIDTFGKLKAAKDGNAYPRIQLESFQIWHSFPRHWRQVISRSHRNYNEEEDPQVLIDYNKWRNNKTITTKELRQRIQQLTVAKKTVEMLNTKFNILAPVDINPFLICKKMTQDIKLRNVQYKILHNIYPTMKHLHTWKIKESPNCTNCQCPETTEHAVWECNIAQETFQNFARIYAEINNKTLALDKQNVIYGMPNKDALNTLLTLIKRTLILQREDKQTLTCEDIKRIIKQQQELEKYIAKKNNKVTKHQKKWSEFLLI